MWAIQKCTYGLTQTPVFKFAFSHLLLVNNMTGNIQVNSTLTTGVCGFLTEHLNVIHAYPMSLLTFLTRSLDLWQRSG